VTTTTQNNLHYKREQLSEQNSSLVEASCQRAGGQMTLGGATRSSDTCRCETRYAARHGMQYAHLHVIWLKHNATNLNQMRWDARVRQHGKVNTHRSSRSDTICNL